jgi:type I restriction enzyme, S subunit
MSALADLIERLCPDGVEFQALGELGEVFRGRRFVKTDYVEEGIGAIHYGQLYTHFDTKAVDVITRVREDLRPNLRFVKPGDVVIAEVGETVEDVGKAVAWLGTEDVAIHDGCYGLRHNMDPVFIAYYLQTPAFHGDKNRHVARAKMKRLSLEGLKQIRIPVPPLEVQREIVSVLERFQALESQLEAELKRELVARRQQYAHYRNALLNFSERERERERERESPVGRDG